MLDFGGFGDRYSATKALIHIANIGLAVDRTTCGRKCQFLLFSELAWPFVRARAHPHLPARPPPSCAGGAATRGRLDQRERRRTRSATQVCVTVELLLVRRLRRGAKSANQKPASGKPPADVSASASLQERLLGDSSGDTAKTAAEGKLEGKEKRKASILKLLRLQVPDIPYELGHPLESLLLQTEIIGLGRFKVPALRVRQSGVRGGRQCCHPSFHRQRAALQRTALLAANGTSGRTSSMMRHRW